LTDCNGKITIVNILYRISPASHRLYGWWLGQFFTSYRPFRCSCWQTLS